MKHILLLFFFNSIICFGLYAQLESDLRNNFQSPTLEHRMNINQHSLGNSQTALNDFCDITLKKNGYGGIATNVAHDSYLDSKPNFDFFCSGVKTIKAKGYVLWLYDEKLYPSGMADTKILDAHPDWEAEGLFIFKKNVNSGQSVSVTMQGNLVQAKAVPVSNEGIVLFDNAVDISSAFSKGKLSWKATAGNWKVMVVTRGVLYTGFQAGTLRGNQIPRYPSLLMPEVTELFLELTHKRYASAFGEPLGNYFTSTFTDEPSTMAFPFSQLGYDVFPWKQVLSDKLLEKYGYNLNDKLLKITLDEGSDGKLLRYQYFKAVTELISQNYFKKIKEYCHSQNTKSGGHLLLEESMVAHVPLYGSIMACYRELDIPGVDCLTGLPEKTRSYMFSSRLAASAAELEGNNRVFFESCPIDNDLPNMVEPPTIDVKGVHNRMIVGGATDFNNYLKLSHENFAGRTTFNDYTARVKSMLSGGVRASRIAVYYPIETMWTKYKPSDMRMKTWWSVQGADPEAQSIETTMLNLTYGLIDNGWEFSYIDAQGLEESVVNNSKLCHGDLLKWDVLILPYTEVLPQTAYHKITEFINKGGKVIALRKLPTSSETEFPSEEITNKFIQFNAESLITYNTNLNMTQLNNQLESMLERDIQFNTYEGFMHSHKQIDGKDVFFIINDKKEKKTLQITLPNNKKWELWNPETGEIIVVNSSFGWTFAPYDGIILRTREDAQNVHNPKNEHLRIYPNPAFKTINVEVVGEDIKKISAYNLLGKVVKKFNLAESHFDISHLDCGNYILNIQTANNIYNQLLIKQ